jgi:hypothetical protein
MNKSLQRKFDKVVRTEVKIKIYHHPISNKKNLSNEEAEEKYSNS